MEFDGAFWQAAVGGLFGGFVTFVIAAVILVTGKTKQLQQAAYIYYVPSARPVLFDDDHLDRLADTFVKSRAYEDSDELITFQHYLDGITQAVHKQRLRRVGMQV